MDRVVANLEAVLVPELEQRRARLAGDSRFAEPKVLSLRHAAILHTIGLTCHPTRGATEFDSYCIHINIIGLSGISLRGFVGWYQPYLSNRLAGYGVYEAMTRPYRVEYEDRLDEFFAQMPPLFRGFERGLRRGRLPSKLRQIWNSLVWRQG